MSFEEPVILSACRTPIGKFLGALTRLKATQIGAIVVEEAVKRSGVKPVQVDECIMGCVLQAGLGQNPARQAALGGGLSNDVAAMTINKVCGSGLKSVVLGSQAIALGDQQVVVAGGMESMTNAPYLAHGLRRGQRLGHGELIDSMVYDGLTDAYDESPMGCTAEFVCKEYGVSREDQDQYSLESHRRAVAAIDAGAFKEEIVSVEIPKRKGQTETFSEDEGPRRPDECRRSVP